MLCKVLNQSRSMQKRQKLLVLFKLQNENNSVTWTGFVSLTWMHRALSCHKHPDFSRVNWFVVINWPSTTTKDKCTQKPLVPACYFFSSFCCCCFFFFNATRLSTEGRLVSRPLWPEFGYYKWANHGPSLESYARSMEWKDSPWLNEAILWKKNITCWCTRCPLCPVSLSRKKCNCTHTLRAYPFVKISTFANPMIHRVYPQNLDNDCIRFLLGHEDDPREIENKPVQFFFGGGGVKEVYYGICESREWRLMQWKSSCRKCLGRSNSKSLLL